MYEQYSRGTPFTDGERYFRGYLGLFANNSRDGHGQFVDTCSEESFVGKLGVGNIMNVI